jgi:hypothetical protein
VTDALDVIVDGTVLAGEEYQAHFERVCRDLDVQQYRVDFNQGVMDLVGGKGTLRVNAILIATLWDPDTWRWVWSGDSGIAGRVEERGEPLRRLGETARVPELVTPELPLVPGLPDRLAHAARRVFGMGAALLTQARPDADGYYLLQAPELVPPAPGLVRVSQLIAGARRRGVLGNHRSAVMSYLAERGIATTRDPAGRWLRAHLSTGDLTISFDADDRITDLSGGAPTRPASAAVPEAAVPEAAGPEVAGPEPAAPPPPAPAPFGSAGLTGLVDRAAIYSLEHQLRFIDVTGALGKFRYAMDLNQRRLDLVGERGTLHTRATLIGSMAVRNGSWLWGWANPVREIAASAVTREELAGTGAPELTEPGFPVPGDAGRLGIAVKPLTGRWINCSVPVGPDTEVHLLLDAPEFALPAPDRLGCAGTITRALAAACLHDHWAAVLSYARLRDIDHTEDPGRTWIRLRLSDGEVTVSFDGHARISEVTAG